MHYIEYIMPVEALLCVHRYSMLCGQPNNLMIIQRATERVENF